MEGRLSAGKGTHSRTSSLIRATVQMLHAVAARCGIGLHPSVERRLIPAKQCLGLCCRDGYSFRPGELLAAVPFWCCPSPLVALATPWGKALANAVQSYEAHEGKIKVAFPRESALTAVFTALAMTDGSPIHAYLQYIEPSVVSPLPVSSSSPAASSCGTLTESLSCIHRLTGDMAAALHADVRCAGLSVDMSTLQLAMRACQSRCMDVPDSEDVLGGPALVPVADLVNHDDGEPNVAVALVTDAVMRRMLKRDRAKSDRVVDTRPISPHCPFFCVMVATEDVKGGTELTYQYLSPEADPKLYADELFWLSRFHFQR